MSSKQQGAHAPIAAEIFLKTLAEHGVDYFFANPGTDFPPIVEAFTRARIVATRKFRSRCWCRTKISRSRWRMAPI